MMKESRLTLVGAGPGDPELITVKGIKALSSADVILYDALVHPSLLDYAPDYALKIFVGKRAGKHYCSQEDIHEKITAFIHLGHIVRLKGGDPFVFGRGFEEMEFALKNDIPTEVIPGISSVQGVGTSVGLPVTLRGVSSSFHVVTAVGKNGKLSKDLIQSTQWEGTVIVLMGLKKLNGIVEAYLQAGKQDTGIAIVQSGTLDLQKIVTGKINNIQIKAAQAGIASPAIIYIGEVVQAFLKQQKLKVNGKKSAFSGLFEA